MVSKADFLVTNSFHGIAFSINYNKQFIAVGKSKYNVRIQSLLRLFHLEDRFVMPDKSANEVMHQKEIDYKEVNENLKKLRKDSIEYLKSSLLS